MSDAAADLQGRALAAGAAAPQVGQDCCNKDHRHQQHRHVFPEMHGFNDGVGVLALHLCHPVQPRNNQAQRRQQIQDPWVLAPGLGGIVHADVEQRSDHAANTANESSHR